MNTIVPCLSGLEFIVATLDKQKISVLPYTDDMVLISLTRTGLKRLLYHLGEYCKEEKLTVNYTKTKAVLFQKRPKSFDGVYKVFQ